MSFSQNWRCLVILVFASIPTIFCGLVAYEDIRNNNVTEYYEPPVTTGWLQSAQDMITSPAGNVVMHVAKELLNRSAGNSQVLSLNLTNLLIIILLKILIFTAGMLGAGHWGGYGYGYARSAARSDNGGGSFGLSAGEDYLITGFLAAQGIGMDDCLYAAACDAPNIAYEYARASRALVEGIKKYDSNAFQNPRYNDLIVLLEKAAYDGLRGIPCNKTITCDNLL